MLLPSETNDVKMKKSKKLQQQQQQQGENTTKVKYIFLIYTFV